MKRKINVARIVWVVSLFLLLIVILLMVMDYKINYQFLKHDYLYFYECEETICVTNVKDNSKKLLSKYDCEYENCPSYKKTISDEYALLEKDTTNILYNYKKNTIISTDYDNYEIIDAKHIIVEKNSLYGVITVNKEIIINPTYNEIGIHSNNYLKGYNEELIIAKKKDKYGIISFKTGEIKEEFKYGEDNLQELIDSMK